MGLIRQTWRMLSDPLPPFYVVRITG